MFKILAIALVSVCLAKDALQYRSEFIPAPFISDYIDAPKAA